MTSDTNRILAWSSYKNTVMSNGWAQIEVTTNSDVTNEVQAYAAGYLEGYVTKQILTHRWLNYYKAEHFCSPTSKTLYCNNLRYYITRNRDHMIKKIQQNPHSEYWRQVHLLLLQAQGLIDGFHRKRHINLKLRMKPFGLYFLNFLGDMETLKPIMRHTPIPVMSPPDDVTSDDIIPDDLTPGSCSALVKMLPNYTDIYMGHATWTQYRSMLRMIKRYNLNFKDESGWLCAPHAIPGHVMAFTSQPGQLYSKNDFYTLSSGLVTMETSLPNYNKQLWTIVRTEYWNVLEWIRNVVANRMASNGREWAEVFSQHNSGNWMILDYNRFHPGVKPEAGSGLLYLLEQMPTQVVYKDITKELVEQTYWPSYNIAFCFQIYYCSSNFNLKWLSTIYLVSYHGCTRAKMFARNQSDVTDVKQMMKLMRYNDYKHDPLSTCPCQPPYTAVKAIASRGDLNPANGTFPMRSMGLSAYGATDAKVVGKDMMRDHEFIAECGPTHDQQPPFQWSTSAFASASRYGMPDKYDFQPIKVMWDAFNP
uniref:Phospholipase B-like n=1 Tax=Ciona savignyi TaxID=51511 RepID=H2Y3Z0_CIOSA